MSRRVANGRAPALWLAAALVLIVAVGVAGVLGSRTNDASQDAQPASASAGSASSVPPTTIVYLTVPRTSAVPATPPQTSPPTTVEQSPPPTGAAPAVAGGGTLAEQREHTFTFPSGDASTSYDSTHHDYPAADMFAPCGTPALAATAGVVEDVSTSDEWDGATDDPATRSGLFVALVDDRGVRYYSSHLASVTVTPGQAVAEGEPVGTVGDTGNAAGTGCHIHFGLSPACLTGWQNRRGLTYPQPFLDDWRAGGDSDPLEAIEAIGCG